MDSGTRCQKVEGRLGGWVECRVEGFTLARTRRGLGDDANSLAIALVASKGWINHIPLF